MAKAVIDWVTLGITAGFTGGTEALIKRVHGATVVVNPISSTATPTETARPTAPATAGKEQLYARVSITSGDVRVEWGKDPTAGQSNGLLIMERGMELIPVSPGDMLSFIELV